MRDCFTTQSQILDYIKEGHDDPVFKTIVYFKATVRPAQSQVMIDEQPQSIYPIDIDLKYQNWNSGVLSSYHKTVYLRSRLHMETIQKDMNSKTYTLFRRFLHDERTGYKLRHFINVMKDLYLYGPKDSEVNADVLFRHLDLITHNVHFGRKVIEKWFAIPEVQDKVSWYSLDLRNAHRFSSIYDYIYISGSDIRLFRDPENKAPRTFDFIEVYAVIVNSIAVPGLKMIRDDVERKKAFARKYRTKIIEKIYKAVANNYRFKKIGIPINMLKITRLTLKKNGDIVATLEFPKELVNALQETSKEVSEG